jgi:hypothetical protein
MNNFQVQKAPTQYFQKNTTLPFNLPLGGKVGVGYVVLDGPVTVSGGTTNGTAVDEGAFADLITNIILRVIPSPGSRYPSGEVVNCSPRGLMRRAITEYRKFMPDLLTPAFTGALGTYQVYTVIPIFFADPNVARQWSTALNADPFAYQTLQLEVETGDISTIFAGNDRSLDVSQLQVRWFDERHMYQGDTYALFQEDHRTFIPQAKRDFVDGALSTQGNYLDWLIMTEVGSAASLQDSILNRLKISSGDNSFYYEMEAKDIRAKMFTGNWYDLAQPALGQYLIDFVDGNIAAAVSASGLSATFDINMVSGSNVDALHLFTRRLFQPVNMDPTWMVEYGPNPNKSAANS